MTMQAIVLSAENRDKITHSGADLSEQDLDTMIAEYDVANNGAKLVFIPVFETDDDIDYGGWATVPLPAMEKYFAPVNFDKMQNDFVDVRLK